MIVIGCSGMGWKIASAYRKEVNTLRAFISSLDYMECELKYRKSPLPALIKEMANETKGVLSKFYQVFANELEGQVCPSIDTCVRVAVTKIADLPIQTSQMVVRWGQSLGRFDLDGQLLGLHAVRAEAQQKLNILQANQDVRIKSYRTIGVCAGIAMAILFI